MKIETHNGQPTFYPKNRKAWREWLMNNHQTEKSIWLILFNKSSSAPSITWAEAVEEALCFGWIDSVVNKRDAESRYQFFSQRKPKSNWSAINKATMERLTSAGLMTEAGQRMIDLAKETGTWNALNDVDALIIPEDLMKAFQKSKTAHKNFDAFPKSAKKIILHWILSAKREETRNTRIEETVRLANDNVRANQYVKK